MPFAVLQLGSGTLGERWGARRTIQLAYLVYALASAGCAPALPAFLAGRALVGGANAFTSPLLLAGLGAAVPPGRLSRSIGVYSSFQAAGQSFAPLLGGIAAVWPWRLAFVVVGPLAGDARATAGEGPVGEERGDQDDRRADREAQGRAVDEGARGVGVESVGGGGLEVAGDRVGRADRR